MDLTFANTHRQDPAGFEITLPSELPPARPCLPSQETGKWSTVQTYGVLDTGLAYAHAPPPAPSPPSAQPFCSSPRDVPSGAHRAGLLHCGGLDTVSPTVGVTRVRGGDARVRACVACARSAGTAPASLTPPRGCAARPACCRCAKRSRGWRPPSIRSATLRQAAATSSWRATQASCANWVGLVQRSNRVLSFI